MIETVQLKVNGKARSVQVDPQKSLLFVLRDDLDLSGTKYGCGEGQCGACTVLIDGQPVRSCRTQIGSASGKQITTIEALAQNGALHPVQKAFVNAGAMQCGYCTAGMIMSSVALLSKHPHPTDQEILRGMEGNICRCGTYPRIIQAIKSASKMNGGEGK